MIVEELINLITFDVEGEDKAEGARRAMDLVGKAARGMALAAVGAATAVVGLVAGVADSLDPIAKQSDALDVAAESLQELNFVMGLTGATSDEARVSMRQFARTTEDALRGTGEGVKHLAKMRLTAQDFADLPLEKRLEVFARGFQNLEQGPEQVAAAMAFLGRSGDNLIPFLQQGPAGIRALRSEFAELATVLTRDELRKFEDFNDNLARIKLFTTGVAQQIALTLMPAALDIQEAILGWAKANREIIQQRLTQLFTRLYEVAQRFARGVYAMGQALDRAVVAVGGLQRVLAALKVLGIFMQTLIGVHLVRAVGAWAIGLGRAALALDLVKVKALLANAAVMLIPAAIAALITGIALVVEDLYRWTQGQESLTGKLLATSDTFKAFVDLVSLSEENLDTLSAWADGFVVTLGKLVDWLGRGADALADFFGVGGGDVAIRGAINIPSPAELATSAGAVAAGAVTNNASRSFQQTNNFNMGGNSFTLGAGASPADLNRAQAQRDRANADEYRRALQTLGTGTEY